jgi:hypothetical protein
MRKFTSILIGLSLLSGIVVAMSAQTGKSNHSIELTKKKKKKGKKGGGPY